MSSRSPFSIGAPVNSLQLRKERAPHFGGACQTRLDNARIPAGIAGQKMRMQIDEVSMTFGNTGDDGIDAAMIRARDARIDAEKIARVVTKRWVIHVTH